MKITSQNLRTEASAEYSFIDSGNGEKLERFGPYRFVRPESQALWRPSLPKRDWQDADGIFETSAKTGKSGWRLRKDLPDRWQMTFAGVRCLVGPTPFRHLGVFPEQTPHWEWIKQKIQEGGRSKIRILNLFGYTGLASLAAALAGAEVTHVDASKTAIEWARENQRISKLDQAPIRWITDDVLKFLKREIKRGAQYDGIILDPPKFGRGPKGEVWKIETDLPTLRELCQKVLSKDPIFVLLTLYATECGAASISNIVREIVGNHNGEINFGELVASEETSGRFLSHAIYARWDK
jgi:23S rRNA (cytosine1962-C5)-methyltransferase